MRARLRKSRMLLQLGRCLCAMVLSGRLPSRRAVAAMAKLCGRRLERRWPFLLKNDLNLEYEDLLELQYARSREFTALVVGAFDGMANDQTCEFLRRMRGTAICVEPQSGPFNRLWEYLGSCQNIRLLNAAVDEKSGSREMYCIPSSIEGLPAWTEQLASFQKEHLLKHEDQAPGLSQHIQTRKVATISFNDLLDRYSVEALDVLQIDAEGLDAQLLAWFPFKRTKPAVLHYEVAHMTAEERRLVRKRLRGLGYTVLRSERPTDDMAICF